MLAVLSSVSLDLSAPVLKGPHSLLAQSRGDPKRLQRDGWGVGWFENQNPTVFKSPRPFFQQRSLIQKTLRHVAKQPTPTVLAHVRWASNPLKLSKQDLIGTVHTQPFTHRRWLFAHNGTLNIPREVKAALKKDARWIRGRNDSEVLFYWLLKNLGSNHPTRLASALKKSIRGLDRIWRGVKKRYPIYRQAYYGLNIFLTDGKMLIAFCYTGPKGFGRMKAITQKRQPYFQLQRRVEPHTVLIASEPLDAGKNWKPFRHGELFMATRRGKRIETKTHKIF